MEPVWRDVGTSRSAWRTAKLMSFLYKPTELANSGENSKKLLSFRNRVILHKPCEF